MVMMRSSEPSSGSSILMDAPDSWRICLILWPPLPMMEPASCKTLNTDLGVKCLFCDSSLQESCFLSVNTCLTYIFWDCDLCCDDWSSDVTVWAPTTYSRRWERTFKVILSLSKACNKKKQSLQETKHWDNNNPSPLTRLKVIPGRIVVFENIGKEKRKWKIKLHHRDKDKR